MGGDHKCPVCQATFTRPQHVARHMRSHTGDRPYKCQYCGDQFARSDLLARHINKCHANEKPPPNTVSGSRRKGSAAASRATTSKQACDQCVQSSLPCDGANPCSKCVSRKCRCTYVKFHRQTAPSGPGHHPPRSPCSSPPLGPRLLPHLDDFILAPPPPGPPLNPFPNSDQVFNTPFTFNPAVSTYPPNWAASDMSQMPFTMPSEADMTAKYRAQAELLRRSGPSVLSSTSPTLLPSMYHTAPHQQTSWYPAWGESGTYPPVEDTKSYDGILRTHSFTPSEPSSLAEPYGTALIGSAYRPRRVSLDFSDSSSATSQSVPSSASSSNVHLPLPGGEMYDGHSEDIHGQTHHVMQHHRRSSMPTSLPPFPELSESSVPHSLPPPSSQPPQRVGEGGFSSAFGLMSIDDPNALSGLSADGVPFFSNLGVGVLPHSPNATPMPTRVQQHQHQHGHPHAGRERVMSLSALPTPRITKETSDARELKDMWKTYMRSPLSGPPGTVGMLEGSTSTSVAPSQMSQSPSGQRRRVRVSSLPSVTPTVEKGHPWMHGAGSGTGGSMVRTSMMNDDLKSYEAAVNARSASLKLNLVPRRKGRPSASGSPQMEVGPGLSASTSVGPSPGDHVDQQGISRPSSSSSGASLAQAFTLPMSQHLPTHAYHHPSQNQGQYPMHTSHLQGHTQAHHAQVLPPVSMPSLVKPPPMQGASISLPIPPMMPMSGLHSHPVTYSASTSSASLPSDGPATGSSNSRASSVTSDGSHGSPRTGTGGSGSESEAMTRPSFKRYPSQTLGPPSSKRVLVERPGGRKSVKRDKARVESVVQEEGQMDVVGERKREERDGMGMGSPGSRPIVGLPERAKRG